MRIEWNNLGPGIIGVTAGAWFLSETYALDLELAYNLGGGMSAAGYPRLLGFLIIALSAILTLRGVLVSLRKRQRDDSESPGKPAVLRAFLTIVAFFAYTVLLIPLGYLIATPMLLTSIMLLAGERSWLRIATTAVLTPIAMYFIILGVFHIVLPQGLLEFVL